jgi:hypothetical protein
MAIKLYKSQLQPTTEGSNVLNRNKVSMAEAASIGNAWKGMVRSGELLYAKHQDIKTDNEVAEKKKEVANGTDNYTGLSEVTKTASTYNDPDSAGKYYNDQWQNIFDNVNGTLSGKQAQRKFKSWMTSQNISDINSIKSITTGNMIAHDREMKLDNIETIKKRLVYPKSQLDYDAAIAESKEALFGKKAQDTFGSELKGVQDGFYKEVAFFTYKNVPLAGRAEALEKAKKDDRLDVEDVQKLISHFKTSNATSTALISDSLASMEKMSLSGVVPDVATLKSYEATLTALGNKPKLLKQIAEIKNNTLLIGTLNQMPPEEVQDVIFGMREQINTNQQNGKGTDEFTFKRLELSEKYLATLTKDLKSDLVTALSTRNVIQFQNIDLQEFLYNGNVGKEQFLDNLITRKSQIQAAAYRYNVEPKYLSEAETDGLIATFKKLEDPEKIKEMTSVLAEGFGLATPDLFRQINEKDNFLAHIGGMTLIAEGSNLPGVDKAIDGYLLSKNKNIDIKISENDTAPITSKYRGTFLENQKTFNTIVGTANYIYQDMVYKSNKRGDVFQRSMYDQAMKMAMGENGEFGGSTKYNGNEVHVPNWLERDEFEGIMAWLGTSPDNLKKATGYYTDAAGFSAGELVPGKPIGMYGDEKRDLNIFENGNPILISVGYGKYKVATGQHPSKGDPKYAIDGNFINQGNNHLIIDLNKIKLEWINSK